MKVLLDRAEKAVALRKEKLRDRDAGTKEKAAIAAGLASGGPGLEGLVEGISSLDVGTGLAAGGSGSGSGSGSNAASSSIGKTQEKDGDEWEVLQAGGGDAESDEAAAAAIQVHQYVVVFLKFMASVTPGIEHDFTMGV